MVNTSSPAVGDTLPGNCQTIELHIGETNQLFCDGPAPFRERDLDSNAEEFIVGWARCARFSRSARGCHVRSCGANALGENRFGGVIRESFLIGGWVAMWRPIEVFLYDWWPIRREARLYDRLAVMPVRIVQD